MPRKKQPKVALPTMKEEAAKRFKERYQNSYLSKTKLYPQLVPSLKQLALVEVQLERVEKMMEKVEKESGDEDVFIALPNGKAPYASVLFKIQKELRSQHTKYLKASNLTLEKKAALKAETSGYDDIVADME